MAKLSGFQITLLSVWGLSAVTALAGSFWLLENDWAKVRSQPARMAVAEPIVRNTVAQSADRYREESVALRNSVQQLERRNRVLASRLDALESDLGLITASIPSTPIIQQVSPSQSMPRPINKPLNSNGNANLQQVGKSYTQPFPLKMPDTGMSPTDSQIGEALLSIE